VDRLLDPSDGLLDLVLSVLGDLVQGRGGLLDRLFDVCPGLLHRRLRLRVRRLDIGVEVGTRLLRLILDVRNGVSRVLHLTGQLLVRGERVVGTVRNPDSVKDIIEADRDAFRAEVLDVRDTAALRAVVDRTVAGEELSDEQIEGILDTNLTASIQFIHALLPSMRANGGGRIIQMSTYGGQTAFPGNSLYHARKWGIEGFCESVAQEVEPFGVVLTIVEPGGARTEFRYGSAQVADALPAYRGTPARSFERML
jgi:short-subunit dehydrogenase involved in D-alanine esterification of teichoic acids